MGNSQSQLQTLLERIESNDPKLDEVDIHHNSYFQREKRERRTLLRSLYANTHIHSILLCSLKLGDADAKLLSSIVKVNGTIKVLHLRGNHISDQGAIALAGSFKSTTCSVRLLDLGGNRIHDAGAQAFARMFEQQESSPLLTLDLRSNQIGPIGGRSLAKALPHAKNLRCLLLTENRIGDDAAQEFIPSISSHPEKLLKVKLQHNSLRISTEATIDRLIRHNAKNHANMQRLEDRARRRQEKGDGLRSMHQQTAGEDSFSAEELSMTVPPIPEDATVHCRSSSSEDTTGITTIEFPIPEEVRSIPMDVMIDPVVGWIHLRTEENRAMVRALHIGRTPNITESEATA